MSRIIYVGPHDQVHVPAFGVTAVRNTPVEVDDDAAEALTATASWKPAPAPKKARKAASTEE